MAKESDGQFGRDHIVRVATGTGMLASPGDGNGGMFARSRCLRRPAHMPA